MASREIVVGIEVDVKNLEKVKKIIEKMKCCQNCDYSIIRNNSLFCIEDIDKQFDILNNRKEKFFSCKNHKIDEKRYLEIYS